VDIRPAAWWRLRGNLWSASHKYFSPERISTNAAGSSDSRQSCGGFGYVETQDARQDEISRAGLLGLSQALFQRTSIEPAPPMGLSLARDELSFFPFLYWPITLGQQALSSEELSKLNRYLKGGGMILFDTRDSDIARVGQTTKEGRVLQQLASGLNLPPLAPIAPDHVLTRSFYLLQDFPGRYPRGGIWVEAPQKSGRAGGRHALSQSQ
jgi:hypothetical protein